MAQHRILLVDDDKDILQIIKLALKTRYEIVTASDGFSGLQKAQATEPDLIILDVRMPKVDGHQLIDAIRHSPKLRSVPIIIITAFAEPEDEFYSIQQGVAAYVAKPFEVEQLVKRIDDLLVNIPVSEKILSYSDIVGME